MPSSSCAIATCKNNYRNSKGFNIIYHRFPKGELNKVWEIKCKRDDNFFTKNATICSIHFTENDYERDLKAELLGLPSKKILRKGAIPSLNIPGQINSIKYDQINRDMRQDKRNLHTTATEIIESKTDPLHMNCNSNSNVNKELNENFKLFQDKICLLEKENANMSNQITKLKSLNSKLNAKLIILRRKLRYHNNIKIQRPSISAENFKTKVKEILKPYFTDGQIAMILGKRRIKWKVDDITNAISLRAVSPKAYKYLRNKLKFPLPGLSTLRRWISLINCPVGLQNTFLKLMEAEGKKMTEAERICILSMDEMKIAEKMSYDIKDDHIIGPHRYVLVCMARGLIKSWKQIIFYDFDAKSADMKSILFQIIKALDKVHFIVVGLTSDLGANNQRLWKDLHISPEKHYFENPEHQGQNIYIFADIPHMIKLVRNHILDSGICINDTIINKQLFQDFIEKNKSELKLACKFTEKHLQVKGLERQVVKFATQTLSETVGTAIKYIFPSKAKESDLIILIDRMFDVLNSRIKYGDKPFRSGLGINEDQFDILNNAYKIFSEMRVVGKSNLLPFQKGILISINSTKKLHKFMLEKYNLNYILTHRLNQDALESFFSQIRSLGCTYDHPSALEVKNRIKLLMIGKTIGNITPKSNVLFNDEEGYLSAKTFDSASLNDNEIASENEDEIFQIIKTNTIVPNLSDVSYEALRYIAGYVAKRLKDSNPHLTKDTPLNLSLSNNSLPDWISTISRGGLVHPSDEWMNIVYKIETIFIKINGENELKIKKNVIKSLTLAIEKDFPVQYAKAINLFIKTRTMIRLKYVNSQMKEKKNLKRKFVKTTS